jgi:hypothetical protein
MDFIQSLDKQWFLDHAAILILSVAVFVEWVALQMLLIHYHFFRQSLKKPTPDGIRFSTIEKVLSFQASQIDRVFGKLSEMNKEISGVSERRSADRMMAGASISPNDSSMMTMGELSLKKRLQELKSTSQSETAAVVNKIKLN